MIKIVIKKKNGTNPWDLSICTYVLLTRTLFITELSASETNRTENSSTTELARENLFQPNMDDAKPNMNNNNNNKSSYGDNNVANATTGQQQQQQLQQQQRTICSIENHQSPHRPNCNTNNSSTSSSSSSASSVCTAARKRHLSNSNLVNDLEILDRELSAINAPMPLIDPEITQGAEQLEKAALSAARKRLRSNSSEDESDRLVREALSQFYMPPQRLISAIEDCPLDVVGMGMNMVVGGGGSGAGATNLLDGSGNSSSKRIKLSSNVGGVASDHLDLVDFDMNQNQKDFEVIMDALRLGTPSPPSGASSDSCGQAAMMSESASVFHNLVVTSLET
ncbi:serum response factor homolog B isoform X2 [Drosophila albomicans]|uniref:Serum response factor homolog B isoform X2 n=1 Tax=Drosophila albomicans TaxID=7291 RepID=A0A9C6SW03_DROAB|nr:serum response factor homolog B isoform X2 [Drosophila albomicans]